MDKKADNVKVAIRCRPLFKREKEKKETDIVSISSSRNEVIVSLPDQTKKPVKFTYDFAYPQDSQQENIYKECAKPVIDFLLEGFNCTIFAYGQTGTGKTFTMEGDAKNPEMLGLIPRSFNQIFEVIDSAGENQDYLVRVSMLELYNENLKDSLVGEGGKKLEIHEDPKTGFYVKELTSYTVKKASELLEKLNYGKSSRQVRATEMNDYSSRSHSIFNIMIESSETDEMGNKTFRYGKLNLVDLAGSEKQKKTKATNEALKEGININLSLTTLGNVINQLVKKSAHVSFRNSKLTKLLADSLGGNSKTLMIANIGPASSNYLETLQTLKYANRAKQIQNKPVVNEDAKDAQLKVKMDELKMLKLQIQQLGLNHNELAKNIDSLKHSVRKIRKSEIAHINGSGQKDNKENELLKKLENEGDSLQQERNKLENRLIETRERMEKEEEEKQALLAKYNSMCKDIITKQDYEKDLNDAKKELNKLKMDKTEQNKYLAQKKILKEKKQQVDHIDAKSKQIKDRLHQINKEITYYREQIISMKENKTVTGQNIAKKIEKLNEDVIENRMKIKRYSFFIQNLIPVYFKTHIANLGNKEAIEKATIEPFAMNNLKKPISCNYYELECSYKNPYVKQIGPKKRKLEYPKLNEIYDNGKLKRHQ